MVSGLAGVRLNPKPYAIQPPDPTVAVELPPSLFAALGLDIYPELSCKCPFGVCVRARAARVWGLGFGV